MSSVWVCNPAGRQVKVTVTPTRTVVSVIAEVCEKSHLNADAYDLVTAVERRYIDPSHEWRYTSIPNNSKLELVAARKPRHSKSAQVKVAIQTQTGRVVGNAPISMRLYNILTTLKVEPPGPDQFPVITFSGKPCTLDKTLKGIGVVSGNILLRVHYRKKTAADNEIIAKLNSMANELMEPERKISKTESSPPVAAVESKPSSIDRLPNGSKAIFGNFKFPENPEKVETEITQERLPCGLKPDFNDFKFPETNISGEAMSDSNDTSCISSTRESVSSSITNPSVDEKNAIKSTSSQNSVKNNETMYPFKNFKFPEKSEKTELANQNEEQLPKASEIEPVLVVAPTDRKLRIYNNNEVRVDTNFQMEVPDSFFEVTVDDVKKVQAKEVKEEMLMTKELKARERKRQMYRDYKTYPECLIRLNLNDNSTIQMTFHPGEKIKEIQNEVNKLFHTPKSFDIFTTPPRIILDPNTTIWSNGLCPRGNCYVTLAAGDINYLDEVWSKRLPKIVKTTTASSQKDSTFARASSSSNRSQPKPAAPDKKSTSGRKIPKWFQDMRKAFK